MPGIIVKRSQEGVTTTVGMLVVFKGKSSHQEGTQVALCFWDAGIVLACHSRGGGSVWSALLSMRPLKTFPVS